MMIRKINKTVRFTFANNDKMLIMIMMISNDADDTHCKELC